MWNRDKCKGKNKKNEGVTGFKDGFGNCNFWLSDLVGLHWEFYTWQRPNRPCRSQGEEHSSPRW